MAICCALLKHGYSNFSITILEYCEVTELLIREKHYWEKYTPEYNIAKKPGAPMSGRKHSDETKQIMSDTAKKIYNSGHFNKGQQRLEGAGKSLSSNRSYWY